MPFILKKYYSPRSLFFFLGEGLLIFLSVNAVYLLFEGQAAYKEFVFLFVFRAALVTIIFQLSLYFFDLYDLAENHAPPDVAARILQAFGVGCVLLAFFYYVLPITVISTRIFWPGFTAVCLSVFIWRFLYNHVLNKKMFAQSVIILGTGKMASDIANEILQRRDAPFKIVYFIGESNPAYPLPSDIPVTVEVELLPELCKEHHIEKVVVAMDDRRGKTPVKELMECKFLGYTIEYGINFYEKLTGKILVKEVNPDWIIFSDGFNKGRLLRLSKQVLDFFLALFGLIATMPVFLLSAIIIRLESPGPIFYLQERVGLDGAPFKVIKFRSMRNDAEKDGPVWAQENDARVTRFGGFIRKVRIDELPQMINVLKGEMSFVGPRPERSVFVEQLSKNLPYYALRHNVKPGISGWAQTYYPYGASEEDALRKLEYDLYYVKYMSLQMDIWVIFQTIKTVLFQRGAR